MVFLGSSAPLQSDLSLIIQVVILVFLVFAITRAKKKEYMRHACLMLVCLTLTLWNSFIVMVPKALSLIRMYRPYVLSLLVRVHLTFGVIVFLLGFYLMRALRDPETRLLHGGACWRADSAAMGVSSGYTKKELLEPKPLV